MSAIIQAELAKLARNRAIRKEIEISGVRTAYWIYPAAKGAKQSTLVLVHGYRGNHHGLEAIAGALPNLNLVIADLPGFGQSQPLNGEHTIENYALWLNSFLRSVAGKKLPHLLGHSFGSIVVSAYAAKFGNIASLILENPVAAPALKGPKALMTAITRAFFWFAERAPEAMALSALKSFAMVRGMSVVMAKTRSTALRKWIHAQHDDNFNDFASRRVAIEGYRASISNCVGDFAAQLKVPTLILAGDRDDITSVKQQQELVAKLGSPKWQLEVFSHVGHLTHYEIPEQIASHVCDWVAQHD